MIRPILLLLSLAVAGLILLAIACGPPTESPRGRVLEFVKLVKADSLPDILPYVELDSLAFYLYFSEKYDTLTQEQKRTAVLHGFMDHGEFRNMFTRSQVVVNDEKYLNDSTATVEVSYIELKSRIQYYTQMGLRRINGRWMITSLRVE
jgi:hypothetical protein